MVLKKFWDLSYVLECAPGVVWSGSTVLCRSPGVLLKLEYQPGVALSWPAKVRKWS